MSELSAAPLSTTEIAERTGRAQSTLSVHLDNMLSRSLISFEYDRADSRRKIFSPSAVKVIGMKGYEENGEDDIKKLMDDAASGGPFFKSILISLLMMAETGGLDISEPMRMLGRRFAESMFPEEGPGKVEDVIRQLQEFYERNSFGEVCLYAFLPLTVIIRNTEEFSYRMESLSAFSQGFFESSLTRATGTAYGITKAEIFGTGNNYYKFILEPVH